MAKLSGYVPPSTLDAVWLALCEDTGVNVLVCRRDGKILYTNHEASLWLRWQHRQQLKREARENEAATYLQDACPEVLLQERLKLGQRVCDENKGITYESLYNDIRWRVTMRPLPAGDGTNHVLILSRRMHPWERVKSEASSVVPTEVEMHDPGVIETLSVREIEVLILIGEGLSYAQIAERLHRSVRTIERHRDRLGQKLNASDRVQLARFAIRAGLSGLATPAQQEELNAKEWDPIDLSTPVSKIANRRVRQSE
ncbi:hypothetical protein MNBD_PLANCTO03-884 [hydrothermal vent metagenome]|uniref:HTH luxR-type domain-containing protein n=1 Tax=hydrothermal vent metagenome TaxID=652676 RepID=A0A3B1DVP7_9ZZZZ